MMEKIDAVSVCVGVVVVMGKNVRRGKLEMVYIKTHQWIEIEALEGRGISWKSKWVERGGVR